MAENVHKTKFRGLRFPLNSHRNAKMELNVVTMMSLVENRSYRNSS